MLNRLIKSNNAGGGGCTDIVDNYDPFGGNGVALYQLNGNANDVSGNYNGTASNVTYGTGVFGQAGFFNGSSSYISGLPTLTNISASYSISVWAKFTSTPSSSAYVFGGIKEQGASDSLIGVFVNTSNNIVFRTRGSNAGTIHDIIASSNYSGQWHNIVVTQDSLKMELFIDGASIGTLSVSPTITLDNCVIGASNGRGTIEDYFAGDIDQFRIFNTALTPLEIEALYTEELCICDGTVDTLDILGDGSCIALYPLDGNANDLSGNYSGTVNGSVSYNVGEFDLSVASNNSSGDVITSSIPSTSVQTLSFWLNISATYSDEVFIGSYTPFRPATSSPAVFVNTGSAIAVALPSIPLNQWNNIVLTVNNGSLDYYLNGSFIGSYSSGINYIYWFNLLIGDTIVPNTHKLDQVRVFNRGISATEVTTLYNETACTKVTRTAGATQILGDSSCIAYYKLDGTADDETGTYNGVFTNADYRNGEFDLAALFNGSSSYILTPTYSTTNVFSMSFWIKALDPNSDTGLFQFYSTYINGNFIGIANSGQNFGWFPYNNSGGSGFTYISSSETDLLFNNQWHNVVVVSDANSFANSKIYIDGVEKTLTISDGFTTSVRLEGTLYFGRRNDGYADYNGEIDQVRVFNKAVSPSEVTTLYNEGI